MKMPKLGKIGRSAACILLVLAVFVVYELRLVQWQLVEGDKYEQLSLSSRTDTIEIEAARGEILDRDGTVLAGNRSSYNIVYDALDMDYDRRNATIIQVIDLLEERGETWRDRLPIVLAEDGTYQYKEDSESAIQTLQEALSLAEYATAEECMAELAQQYDCQGYSKEDMRNVASVRYSMTQDGFSRTSPYVIAEDVSAETVGVISERSEEWPGIEIRVAVTRYYGEDGALAPHVVGYTGVITDTQYQQAVEDGTTYDAENNISGYKWSDTMGRSGIEAAFEEELRGQRGEETIYTDSSGGVESTAVTTAPEEGHTVQTTLDSDLQRVANLSLEKNIQGNIDARNWTSGAAVVLDVDTFGVLACSSYPTYDVNQLVESIAGDGEYYNNLLADEDQPMVNLALNGVFIPGSVFKPVVALAALQEGVISAGTTYTCGGVWNYFDLSQGCLCGGGTWNLYGALAHSCNTYFSNVGLNHLGIARLAPYAEYFGLGTTTGVEIGESTGTMSNPQEYRENHGVNWTDGVSAQTAIGQADNMFTPIQLATMCATIANGGVRLQTHFLDKITDYTGEQVIEEYEPVELYDAGLSSAVLGVVQTGMQMVATEGTAGTVFANYPVSIACKTGTAETSTGKNGTEPNLSFICYAPADDPEIAIAVMMEYGNTGNYAKYVAKDILDQYFGFYTWDEEGNKYDSEGNLLDEDGTIKKTAAELEEEKAQQEETTASGDEGQDGTSTAEPTATPTPTATPDRGSDIPDAPFTGETASPTPVPEDSSSSDPSGEESSSSASSGPEGPYYQRGSP